MCICVDIDMHVPLHSSQPCRAKGAAVTQSRREPCRQGHPRRTGHGAELTPRGPWRSAGQQLRDSCLQNPTDGTKWPEDTTAEVSPPGQKVSSMILGKSGGYLLPAGPEWKQCLTVAVSRAERKV